MQRKIWILAGKVNAGEATEDEKRELEQLLFEHPEYAYGLEMVAKFWNSRKLTAHAANEDRAFEKLVTRIERQMTQRQPRIRIRRYLAYAASILMLVSLGAIWNMKSEPTAQPLKKIIAANGTRNQVMLPDGSKVWLNAGSSLSYPENKQDDSIREVFLTGEAYFEVVHRKERPFLIHTAQMNIRDIGTAFNVRAYPEEGFSEATLIEGAIEVSFNNKKEKTVLSVPHQKIRVYTAGDTATESAESVNGSTTLRETAWMENMLVFKNETFEQLRLRMERYYNVEIEIQDLQLKNRRFTGAFSNENIEQAFAALQLIVPFHYTIDGRKISVRR